MNKLRKSHKKVISYSKQVMNRLLTSQTSHEQSVNKLWVSNEQVINNLWKSHEQVMS